MVAGDAMHVMAPFFGQGGSTALEDAVVLARSLSRSAPDGVVANGSPSDDLELEEKIRVALGKYVTERRPRLVFGTLLSAKSLLKRKKIGWSPSRPYQRAHKNKSSALGLRSASACGWGSIILSARLQVNVIYSMPALARDLLDAQEGASAGGAGRRSHGGLVNIHFFNRVYPFG
jgi:hypothetical protein